MRVSMRGWARDHGSKTLLVGSLAGIDARENVDTYSYQGLSIEVTRMPDGGVEYVEIAGRATITLNGDYLTKVRLTRKDLFKLVGIALRDMTFEAITRRIGRMYDPDED